MRLPPPRTATFVGSERCAECHAPETQAWRGSQHQLAMQAPDEQSVLGDFNDASFTYAGVTSSFLRRDGRYIVRTDGPDGKLADFEVRYTFGVYPLQQYLLELPGGKLQALSIAWDSRPRAAGGQRWFHLYADEKRRLPRRTALDAPLPELELHVRGLPLDQRAQGLRRRNRFVPHDVLGNLRRLRGVPRSRLRARASGREPRAPIRAWA